MDSKEKIKQWKEQIIELEDKIIEEADTAMLDAGIMIQAYDLFTGKKIPNVYDDAQWFNISTEWDCIPSPFGYCMYHSIHDKVNDNCVFCHHPKERK